MRERLVEFEVDEHDGIVVARVIGEVDRSNASDLRLALTERLSNVSVALVLDLSEVGYIDSSGVQLLFDLGRRLAARRQKIRLVVPPDAPTRRVLELCDVGNVAPIDERLETSLGALDESG